MPDKKKCFGLEKTFLFKKFDGSVNIKNSYELFNIIKFGLIFILLSFLSILFNIVMGFIGIQFFYGTIVALLITIISIYFKVILPLYIGSFFGMIHVLEWHWLIATLICLPGLLFITPNLFKKVFNIKP